MLLLHVSTKITKSHDSHTTRKEAGSRVKFRVTIPTNIGEKFQDCIEDISYCSSNFGPYHRLSVGSNFGNMSQRGCFGGAPVLG